MPATAHEIVQAVRARELDAVEVVERALRELEAHGELNAFITVCAEQALERARGGVDGPLAGVPLLVKDVFDTAGIRTTAGSRIYAERVPDASAPAVLALEAAGAIVIGKTGCDEFAWGVTGQNAIYGDVRNPRRPGCITGGSSSGNAAALAAGIAPLALGSDTGGSVRMPAACCDVVGMKPRLGALPTDGMFPLCPSFDTPGPMARTVADCARCYEVLAGAPLRDRDPRYVAGGGSHCDAGAGSGRTRGRSRRARAGVLGAAGRARAAVRGGCASRPRGRPLAGVLRRGRCHAPGHVSGPPRRVRADHQSQARQRPARVRAGTAGRPTGARIVARDRADKSRTWT